MIDQDDVHYVIGEVCSSASIPISEIANAKGVVQISPISTNERLTVDENGKTRDYIFRACFIDPFQGRAGTRYAIDSLRAKTAFIMVDPSNTYVVSLSGAFEKAFKIAGGKIVGKENYSSEDTDFGSILAKVADAKPDLVYLPDYFKIVNLVTSQAKLKGMTIPFMGGDGWDSSALDLKAAAGSFFTNHYSPADPRSEDQTFLKAYGARYKDDKGNPKVPDALAALAYDSTNIMLEAIKAAGVDNPAKVKDVLAKINYNGVTGKITFDAQHNPTKSVTILAVKENGVKFETVVNP